MEDRIKAARARAEDACAKVDALVWLAIGAVEVLGQRKILTREILEEVIAEASIVPKGLLQGEATDREVEQTRAEEALTNIANAMRAVMPR